MDLPSPTLPQGDANSEAEISPASRCHRPPGLFGAGRKTTIKGSRAKFLYENPRFINEPIRYVVPDKGAQSVGECLDWSEMENEVLMPKQSLPNTTASTSAGDSQT